MMLILHKGYLMAEVQKLLCPYSEIPPLAWKHPCADMIPYSLSTKIAAARPALQLSFPNLLRFRDVQRVVDSNLKQRSPSLNCDAVALL